ncbi:hypothetical protein diail_700 [Diaporthe ilicicola]|nr:hypothetical protein diail_700 [Diaporthe ilicicola]
MSRFNLLAGLISLGAAVVQAQDASQPWALGTRISIMAVTTGKQADASTACPGKLSDAIAAPADFAPVQANLDMGIIVAGNPNPYGKLIESFYLTNGVALPQQSLEEATTRIRVDGQNLCWFRGGTSGNVRLGLCRPDLPEQAFTVAMPAEGQTTTSGILATDDGGSSMAVVYEIPARTDTPITFGDGSQIRFCIYDTDTGVPLTTPADQAAAYTAQVTYTNLTSTSFKDGAPKSESDAPQCNWAAWGEDGPNGTATNIQESSSSPDCILARTAATMPTECADDPTNGDCILHVALAFCADLPEVREALPAAESNAAIESCIRKASLGPCVANPGGAACASGLFAGIAFVDGADGSGSGSAAARMKRQQVDLKTLLFGDPKNPDSQLPFESQFFLGIAKNLINSAATVLNMLATPFAEELRWKCQEASMWTHLFNNQTGEKVRQGCAKMFATWDNSTVPQLEMNTPFEQAGSIFADVATLLSAVGDVVEAAKTVSAVDWVMGKFGLKAAQLGKEEGLVLEAVEGENTVQIFRDAGDGSPALIKTEAEGEALAREVDESAFRDCMECIEAGLARRREPEHGSLLRPRVLKRKLCCAPGLTLKLDVPPPVQGPLPLNLRTLGAVSGETNDVLTSMSTSFSTWYKDGKAVLGADANVDETSQLLLSTTKTRTSKNSEMIGALEKLYGIDARESYALKNWFGAKQTSRMLPGLEEAMAKMPYATGTTIRSTNLDAETLKMLDEGAAGIVSQGEKGVYEVRDLVINKDPMYPDAPAERKILAATMELNDAALTFNGRYFFVINSKSGRLTAPFSGEWLREVDFVQGSSGKFRLIGKQELNGGAAAAAEAGAQGPFAVYYFDEVEAPTAPASFTTEQVTQALKDANVRWEGNP